VARKAHDDYLVMSRTLDEGQADVGHMVVQNQDDRAGAATMRNETSLEPVQEELRPHVARVCVGEHP